jgi:hypothetical protein
MAESATHESVVRSRRSLRTWLELTDEPAADLRVADHKAARTRFRVYCIACSRSSEGESAPPRLSRCEHCGGTMLVEPVAA